MSLRIKFILALLATSLVSMALVGVIAHGRLMRQFDELALERAARNFRGDVASYWLTYGSWDAGQQIEPFRHFTQRRKALLGPIELRPRISNPDGKGPDLGGANEAAAIEPWSSPYVEPAPPSGAMPDHVAPPRDAPPFRFVLFDPAGKILGPPPETGRALRPEEQHDAIPISVEGRIVAFAAPHGLVNFSGADSAYLAAVWDALGWGTAAAALMAVALGLLVGTGMSRSLRKLTVAVRNMQGGTLRQQVDTRSRDEVGELARAFNAMSSELAESHAQLQASHFTISRQAAQLQELAIRDALTGLANRRHFDDLAARMYDHALRHGRPMAVAICDVDFFKRINDEFSHAIGDAVLRELGELMRLHLRSSDLAARYGGEEFVFAFPDSDLDAAAECCERLRHSIERHPWHTLHVDLKVTISVGLVGNLALGGVQSMLAAADRLLYEAKISGRNRLCRAADERASSSASPALDLAQRLSGARSA
jgi:diguanylate cyclase (GGDEF)-like protein